MSLIGGRGKKTAGMKKRKSEEEVEKKERRRKKGEFREREEIIVYSTSSLGVSSFGNLCSCWASYDRLGYVT